jgi:hypothetical protein
MQKAVGKGLGLRQRIKAKIKDKRKKIKVTRRYNYSPVDCLIQVRNKSIPEEIVAFNPAFDSAQAAAF